MRGDILGVREFGVGKRERGFRPGLGVCYKQFWGKKYDWRDYYGNKQVDSVDNFRVLSFWHGGIRVRTYGALHIQRREEAGKRDDACGDDSCHGNPGGGFRGDSTADTRDSEQLELETRDG